MWERILYFSNRASQARSFWPFAFSLMGLLLSGRTWKVRLTARPGSVQLFLLFVVSYNHLVYLPPLGCVGVDGAFGLNNGDIIGGILFPDKVCG